MNDGWFKLALHYSYVATRFYALELSKKHEIWLIKNWILNTFLDRTSKIKKSITEIILGYFIKGGL